MPLSSRTFRIFVSSTFSDLKAERNALQERVFPRLRQLAEAHGCRFQAIDLRWGVSEEAALDQQTMKICLGEIERCQRVSPRPNFIVLLGDRFGWRPLPYAIPAEEFERLLPFLSETERDLACWQESRPAEAQGWYRRDDNAVPPEYVLLPRQPGSTYADYAVWESQVERPLVTALERAARQAGLSPDAMDKYALSATGQEIVKGALQTPDARQHVFCFLREVAGLPQDGRERGFYEADPEIISKQAHLKARLKQQLPGNIHEYTASWLGETPSLDHLETLCNDVYAELSRVMLAEMASLEAVDPLEKENAAHNEFGKDRSRCFTGRSEPLKAIGDYLAGSDAQPLVIWGPSGSGKSALLARAAQEAQQAHPKAVVLTRFIGATPSSSNGRALLEDLCRQITHIFQGDESSIPTEYRELVQAFPRCLALANASKSLIIFLDALDQLSPQDRANELAWLPVKLPENVRLVVSILQGLALERLKNRLPASSLVQVEPMSPVEGAEILDAWLRGANRSLTEVQRSDILAKFTQGGGLPLYLKLAFEEARRWRSFDGLPFQSDQLPGLSADIPGILNDLFWRLEQESNHGQELVAKALGYLAAARNGLSEDEILDVLWADPDIRSDFFRRSPKSPQDIQVLPVVIWSRLYLDLEPYLAWRQADGTELLGYYHRQVVEAVQERYCDADAKPGLHRHLAAYFGNPQRPFWLDAQHTKSDRRKTSELVYQQAFAGLADDLSKTLTTFDFLHAYLTAAGAEALIGDYDLFPASNEGLRLIQDGLRLSVHILIKDVDQLPSQLFGRLIGFSHPEILDLLESARAFQIRPWLRPRTPCMTPPGGAEIRTFTGHTQGVTAVKLLSDGRYAISASHDDTLRLWDLESGREIRTFTAPTGAGRPFELLWNDKYVISPGYKTLNLWDLETSQELRTFTGHMSHVVDVVVLPDSKRAISASWDYTLKLWHLETGECLRTFSGHTDSVLSVVVLADGHRAISASFDKTFKLWDLETGAVLRNFTGHMDFVRTVVVLADGKRAISISNCTLKLWRLDTGECLHTFAGHTKMLTTVAMLKDNKRFISASNDCTLKLWHLETGECLRTFTGHSDRIATISVLADNKRAISTSDDYTIKLWQIETGECLRTFTGHTREVIDLAVLPDGKRAISASHDNTLKLWDLEVGEEYQTFKGHTNHVNDIEVFANGRRAITASSDKTLKLWDLETHTELSTFSDHKDIVTAITVLADNKRAISASADCTLKLWNLATGKCLHTYSGHKGKINAVALLSDSKRAISASEDKTLKLWDLETGKDLRTFTGHMKGVNDVVVLPDGKRAISASEDCTLSLWDLETNAEIHIFKGHKLPVYSVAALSDGMRAVSASMDNTLKLWDIETGKEIRTFIGHTTWVRAVVALANSQQAISSSVDGIIKLWELESAECLRTFPGHTDRASGYMAGSCALTLTARDRRLLSASPDHTLKLWDLETDKCLWTYYADGPLTTCAESENNTFIAGESIGRIHFLRQEGNLPGPLLEGNQPAPPPKKQQGIPAQSPFLQRLTRLIKLRRS